MRLAWVAGACLAVSAEVVWSSADAPENRLPTRVEAILAAPDAFELWSLASIARGEPKFMGSKVLGKTNVDDQLQQTELVKALTRAISDRVGMDAAACFFPRHAIRVRKGNDEATLLICFECGQMHVTLNDEDWGSLLMMSWPQAVFDSVLVRAGVPLDPDRPRGPVQETGHANSTES